MQYYRCKCGKSKAWGFIGPSPCTGCPSCGTTLDQSPMDHTLPLPHTFITKYDEDTGKPYELCGICLRTKAELEQRELVAEEV